MRLAFDRLPRLGGLVLLLGGFLPFTACGGGSGGFDGSACNRGTHQVAIRIGPVPEGAGGETRNTSPCNATITLLEGLQEEQLVAIIVHELWHAVGYSGMHNDEGCYTAPTVRLRVPDAPCPIELAQMQSVGGTFEITLVSEEVDGAVQAAVAFWNAQVGRTMFVYP
jgi:hypothetical protein